MSPYGQYLVLFQTLCLKYLIMTIPGFLGLDGPDDSTETAGDIFAGMLTASGCCLAARFSLSSDGGNVLMSFPNPGAAST